MGVAAEGFSEWAGNLVARVFGSDLASKVRKVLPESLPEPQLQDYFNAKRNGRILFRNLHFFSGASRYVASEPLWQDFEAFYRAPQPLAWWLITGSAGSGKSRTAFEFCKALEAGHTRFFHAGIPRSHHLEPVPGENHSIWKTGFPDLARTPFKTWETWQPRHHTLLVFDDVARQHNARLGEKQGGEDAQRNRHNVVEIIKLLAARAEKGDFQHCRVRLLLLEQERGEVRHQDWYSGLPRHSAVCFRPEPTLLPAVPPGGLFISLGQTDAPCIIPWDFLKKLREVDSEQRPLYAMLLAAYIAANSTSEVTWKEVLEGALRQEYERELKPAGEEKATHILKAMALSTLTGGKAGSCTMDDVCDLWYSGFGYEDASSGLFRPYPVEPDLLGGYLVLGALEQARIFGRARLWGDDIRALIHHAWETFPSDVSSFFDRCAQNFLSDPDWIETKFLNEQLAQANIATRLWYIQTAVKLIARFDKEQVGIARKVVDEITRHAGKGFFRREIARAATSLIRLYARAGMLDEAHTAFLGMKDIVGNSEDARFSHIEAAACLIDGLSRVGELVRARLLFEEMQTFGDSERIQSVRADALVSLINGYGRTGELVQARILLDSMARLCAEAWAQRARASVNLLILYARQGSVDDACAVFEGMSALGNTAPVQDERSKAFRFLEFFTAQKIRTARADALISLIHGHGRTGELAEARALFNGMGKICGESSSMWVRRAQASVSLVILYGRAGQVNEACGVFEDMNALGESATVCEERAKAFRFLKFFTDKELRRGAQEPVLDAVAA
jgi:pentatricopeptide repeat protein